MAKPDLNWWCKALSHPSSLQPVWPRRYCSHILHAVTGCCPDAAGGVCNLWCMPELPSKIWKLRSSVCPKSFIQGKWYATAWYENWLVRPCSAFSMISSLPCDFVLSEGQWPLSGQDRSWFPFCLGVLSIVLDIHYQQVNWWAQFPIFSQLLAVFHLLQ